MPPCVKYRKKIFHEMLNSKTGLVNPAEEILAIEISINGCHIVADIDTLKVVAETNPTVMKS